MNIRLVDGPRWEDVVITNLPVLQEDLDKWEGQLCTRRRQEESLVSGKNPSGCVKYYKRVHNGKVPTYELVEKLVSEVIDDGRA